MSEVRLYELLPEKNKVDIQIPLERFLSLGDITEAEKERFSRYFISATLKYVFREKDGDFEGIVDPQNGELHILEIQIRTRSMEWYDLMRFAIAVKQSYPNNLLLVLRYKDAHCFFAAVTHINCRNQNKDVVDKIRGSGWITRETERYYLADETERRTAECECEYPIIRTVNDRICRIIRIGKTMEEIMRRLCKAFQDDKTAWTSFYHCSKEYEQAAFSMLEAEYCDSEDLYKENRNDAFDVNEEDCGVEDDEEDYDELDEKYYDPFGGDEDVPNYGDEYKC